MAAPRAPEASASFVAAIASGLSSALPVAAGLSAGARLLAGPEAIAGAGFTPGVTPAVGEIDGVFPIGVVSDDEGVPVLLDDDGVPVGDVLLDGDVLGEFEAVGEQLGVDGPVYPLLELPYGVAPPVLE